jgi:hypothetical protein
MFRRGENPQEEDRYTTFSRSKEELKTPSSIELLSKVPHSHLISTALGLWKNNSKPLPRQLVVEVKV